MPPPFMFPRFDHPEFLLLALLALPLTWWGWRALHGSDTLRRALVLGLRAALLIALAIMLAGPHLDRQHHQVTVIGLLDISGSVQKFARLESEARNPTSAVSTSQRASASSRADASDINATFESSGMSAKSPLAAREDAAARFSLHHPSSIEYIRRWFRSAVQLKEPDDRFGLIVFDGKSIAISTPSTSEKYVDDNLDVPMVDGTNIGDALRLGLAMFPADTAKRLVLVSDGNQTAGDAIEAARQAAANDSRLTFDNFRLANDLNRQSRIVNQKSSVPIDVLPIIYRVTGDVQIVRVEAPPTAQPNQTITQVMV